MAQNCTMSQCEHETDKRCAARRDAALDNAQQVLVMLCIGCNAAAPDATERWPRHGGVVPHVSCNRVGWITHVDTIRSVLAFRSTKRSNMSGRAPCREFRDEPDVHALPETPAERCSGRQGRVAGPPRRRHPRGATTWLPRSRQGHPCFGRSDLVHAESINGSANSCNEVSVCQSRRQRRFDSRWYSAVRQARPDSRADCSASKRRQRDPAKNVQQV